ncbi:DUF3526 domain-containing protein [uncultured Algimonas sp.]|uniref:DUF3526 domain-containing protein n=1 Tax=uncultured Algimonas sp. TaxID=1547920 RepID=UPI00262EBDCF|nr:DUF3526 domain-containing protein [uncultured Algimonas sp.]
MNGRLQQEWRLFLKAPATLPLLIVLTVLSAFAVYNGSHRVVQSDRAVAAALADDIERYATYEKTAADFEAGLITEAELGSVRNAHSTVLFRGAARVLIPVRSELGFLSAAEQRPTPDLQRIGINTRYGNTDPALDNPENRLDGPFDSVFIISWLVPLFVLLLSYDVMARDREHRGSALLAAQAGGLRTIIVQRLLVRFAAVFGIVATILLLGTLYNEPDRLGTALPGLAVLLLGLGLIIGFWICLSAGINARAKNAATAGLVLLTVWVGTSLLAPVAISIILNRTAPPPDRLQGILEMREIQNDLNRRRDAVSQAYYDAQPDNRPVRQGNEYEEYWVRELYPRILAFDAAFAPLAQEREAARVRQSETLRRASVVSPSLAMKLLGDDLSGGTPERRQSFLRSVDDYQRQWRDHFDDKLASMRPLTAADYASAPIYIAPAEDKIDRMRRLVERLAALALAFAVAFAWAWWSLKRVEP